MNDQNLQIPIIIFMRNILNTTKTRKHLKPLKMRLAWFKKIFIKNLMSLYLQNKFIQFTLKNMLQFDKNMIELKEQDVKIQPSEKLNYCESIVLQNILSAHYCLPLWHMSKSISME